MKQSELTIIIPFCNEKYEIEETLKSIREYSEDNVEILLINDASDDNFDYKTIAEKYNATYLVNTKRLGVAASRDIGVQACNTPYFLLLDAHMRFYDNLWLNRILEELKSDPKVFLCCQTKALIMENGILWELMDRTTSYGAYIVLKSKYRLFEFNWIIKEPYPESRTILIPCVLGAGYACSKEYWLYLNGLEGLMEYGYDEVYISIKVGMAGGSCKLLKDIIIGHLYRYKAPYLQISSYRLYNRLFLGELFLSSKEKKIILSEARLFYDKKSYSEAQYLMIENTEQINRIKKYHKKIFTKNFDYFKQFNDKYATEKALADNVTSLLKSIAERIANNLMTETGIMNGQMGIVIFLYHYAKFAEDLHYKELSNTILEKIVSSVKPDLSYCFISGLCGIGWGIEYLYQQGFIEGDTNEILNEFDKKIMEINPLRMDNMDRDYGLGGIVLYLLSRLYTIRQEKKVNPFDAGYLSDVYQKVKQVIDQRDVMSDSIDVFLAFQKYFEKKQAIEKPEIYDVYCLLNPKNIHLHDLDLGLKGCAGIGLKLILDECLT